MCDSDGTNAVSAMQNHADEGVTEYTIASRPTAVTRVEGVKPNIQPNRLFSTDNP